MKNIETMNMNQLMQKLKDNVEKYNLSANAQERLELAYEQQKIIADYNELSLLHEYARFMKEEVPLVALVKQYYYETITVRDNNHTEVVDGKKTISTVRVINYKDTKFKIDKFIEWAEEGNKCITPDRNWRNYLEESRKDMIELWKSADKSKGDTYGISINKMKKAIQKMVDALVRVETPSGDNAIVANREAAIFTIKSSNVMKDSKANGKPSIGVNCLNKSTWGALQMNILHNIVENKQYYVLYGDEKLEDETEE